MQLVYTAVTFDPVRDRRQQRSAPCTVVSRLINEGYIHRQEAIQAVRPALGDARHRRRLIRVGSDIRRSKPGGR